MSPSYEVLQQQKRYKENINIQGMLVKKKKENPKKYSNGYIKKNAKSWKKMTYIVIKAHNQNP